MYTDNVNIHLHKFQRHNIKFQEGQFVMVTHSADCIIPQLSLMMRTFSVSLKLVLILLI